MRFAPGRIGAAARLAAAGCLAAASLACGTAPQPSTATTEGTAADTLPESAAVASVLRWTATSEQGVYGYLVYRADVREGPFRRISAATVRVPRDEEPTHRYEFADAAVLPGRTYYYYLDVVSEAGLKQRFSGIIEKVTSP